MVLALDVDLVIERTSLNGELEDVVSRLIRDLQVSAALCTLELGGRRRLLASAGADALSFLRSIRAVDAPRRGCCSQVPTTSKAVQAAGIGAYVAAAIDTVDATVAGVLWAADVTRRWFDHDEVHHLGLLARRAEVLLRPHLTIGLDEPTLRLEDRVLALN